MSWRRELRWQFEVLEAEGAVRYARHLAFLAGQRVAAGTFRIAFAVGWSERLLRVARAIDRASTWVSPEDWDA